MCRRSISLIYLLVSIFRGMTQTKSAHYILISSRITRKGMLSSATRIETIKEEDEEEETLKKNRREENFTKGSFNCREGKRIVGGSNEYEGGIDLVEEKGQDEDKKSSQDHEYLSAGHRGPGTRRPPSSCCSFDSHVAIAIAIASGHFCSRTMIMNASTSDVE